MSNKKLAILAAVAVALCAAAIVVRNGAKHSSPKLNGTRMVESFRASEAAKITIGDTLSLSAGEEGWQIDAMQGYPADRSKIVDALMRLGELKVGQVVRGRDVGKKTRVAVLDAAGKELAAVTLGDEKRGLGRYAEFRGQTVLVADSLGVFDEDPKRWCETKIVDEPWISFSELADPSIPEDEFGFSTGVVKTVTIAGDTNRVATVGAVAKDGKSRYLRLDGSKWTYVIPSYSAERLLPKPPEPEKAEEAAEPEEPASEDGDEPVAEEPEAPAAEDADPVPAAEEA